MSYIADEILNALKRVLDSVASVNMSDTLAVINGICSYTVTGSADAAILTEGSIRFLTLGLIATVMYGVYQLWFGEGMKKIKSMAEDAYNNKKMELAAVLGGPELYSALNIWLSELAVNILAATNILIIFKIVVVLNPLTIFLVGISNIFLEISGYIYQLVLDNGYFLFRPLGIFLLFFPRNGLANKAFRVIGYNMLFSVALALLVFSLDNTARLGSKTAAIAWVATPFFSYIAYKILRFIYAYAWDPEKEKEWIKDTIKNAPARTAENIKNTAINMPRRILEKIIHRSTVPKGMQSTAPPGKVPQVGADIVSRK